MSDKQQIGTRDAYGKFLMEVGTKNEDIVVLDADLSCSTQTCKFADRYPERFFNVGIAEQNLIGTAAGLAAYGKIPYASTFAVFATGRAWEQVRQSLCVPKLPVKIVATHGGITVGPDGGSHQMTEDFAIMRALPHMSVFVPADAHQARAILEGVIDYTEGPCYIRLSRIKFPVIYDEKYTFEPGKADVLRNGTDIAIIAVGYMVHIALEAAEELAKDGVDAMVINMASIKPIDEKAVLRAAGTGHIVTLEEHQRKGGLGSAVAEVLAEKQPTRMKIMGVDDEFGLSGKPDELIKIHKLTPVDVVENCRQFLME